MLTNANLIKPNISGVSDKFSWNFYKYIKKHGVNQRILFDGRDGKPIHPMNIYVLNRTIGNTLLEIMTGHGINYDFSMYLLNKYTDITEQFCKQYLRQGRCMFDPEHNGWWLGDESRFTMINKNSKRCRWCGKHLRRNIVKHVNVQRKETWELENDIVLGVIKEIEG
jgi:hypothetical protein